MTERILYTILSLIGISYFIRLGLKDSLRNSGIYCFYEKKTILYVGKSINLKQRLKTHAYELKENKHCNGNFQEYYNKKGLPKSKILKRGIPHNKLNELEREYINKLKPKFNIR